MTCACCGGGGGFSGENMCVEMHDHARARDRTECQARGPCYQGHQGSFCGEGYCSPPGEGCGLQVSAGETENCFEPEQGHRSVGFVSWNVSSLAVMYLRLFEGGSAVSVCALM